MATNKRLSELSPITAAEVASDDLFLLSDVSNVESKKLTVSEFGSLAQLYVSASATASWTRNCLTASYLLYQGFPNGTASYALTSSFNISSSHATRADTASYALFTKTSSLSLTSSISITSSYSITCSYVLSASYSSAYADYARSASYLIYNGIPNGTASHALIAALAVTARTASYLLYTPGTVNGTAYWAITASNARTASQLAYVGVPNGTASYALVTEAFISSVTTASYLSFNGTENGTAYYAKSASQASSSISASYALTASYFAGLNNISSIYTENGPYNGVVSQQTSYPDCQQVDFGTLNVNPSDSVAKNTIIEIWGTCTSEATGKNQNMVLKLIQGATETTLDWVYQINGGAQRSGDFYIKWAGTLIGSWDIILYETIGSGSFNYSGPSGIRPVRCYIKSLADNWSLT